MNEIQLIRREIAAQRRHAGEAAAFWSSRLADSSHLDTKAHKDYFVFILSKERLRAGSHFSVLRPDGTLTETERRVLDRCMGAFELLSAEADALPAGADAVAVRRIVELLNRLEPIIREVEAIAESRYGVEAWRRTGHVDADSIFEERRLRERALEPAHGPASG